MSKTDEARWRAGADVGRKIMREMLIDIEDVSELAVLWFIYARTYQFGEVEARIPIKHFMEGVFDIYGVVWTAPLPLSRPTIYRCLDRLEAKNMIFRERGNARNAPLISINPDWSHSDNVIGRGVVSHTITSTVSQDDTYCLTSETNRDKDMEDKDLTNRVRVRTRGLLENVTEASMSIAAVNALTATLAATTENTRQRREGRKAKLNATAIEKIWADAFKKRNPTEKYFAWTQKTQASVKRAIHKHIELSEAKEFIEWVVANFDNVIAQQFSGFKDKPRYPEPFFFVKFINKFWIAFEDFRDPNRALNARVARDAAEGKTFKPKPKPRNTARETELEIENAALKEKLRAADQKDQARKVEETRRVKKLVTNRRTSDPELGRWDD